MEDWLRSIDLAHRAAAFRAHGITRDQLLYLSEADFRELGLTIGERKRLQLAIPTLGPHTPGVVSLSTAEPETTKPEWRPLTVMFVDLIDSTALSERLDAEDLLEVIRSYQAFGGAAITRFGGYISRFVGDGILAYFCYPIANENDPERAVRAALEIIRGIGSLVTPAAAPLQVRIGIATGRVVMSGIDGELGFKDTATGSVLNLAARLQTLARPNGIVVAEQTYARIKSIFHCESIPAVQMRGFDQPRRPSHVIGEAQLWRPGLKGLRRHLGPMHGREAELEVLRAHWNLAERGDGRSILVMGEAGIGKSRLIEHMLARHLPDQAPLAYLSALAFDEASPLRPVVDYLRDRAGLAAGDKPAIGLEKLAAALVGGAARKAQALPILAPLVGIPLADHAASNLSPEQLRERTISVLIEQLMGLPEGRPACLVVEDLHWLDPTSRELLDAIVEQIAGKRILLLMTARDGFTADWMDRPGTTVVRLGRLNMEHVGAIIRGLFGETPFPDRLLPQVAGKTDGVPLFAEELARVLLERVLLSGSIESLTDVADHAIPASLQESLMARLDRSGAAKEVAQIAAVVGRSVRRDVLAAVCEILPNSLEESLATLVRAGILDRHTQTGITFYNFSHAMLQDAAYGTLLRNRRKEMHLRVARALESLDAAGMARNPEVLALHLTSANLADEAAPHWLEAARRSLARSALTEAIHILRRALDPLERLPSTAHILDLRLQISALLGPALIGLKGSRAAETRQLYTTAYEIARQLAVGSSHFPIYWGWWRLSADGQDNLERSDALMKLAVRQDDVGLILQAHHSSWASHLHFGAFDRCCAHVQEGLSIYHKGDYRHHARLFGNHDAKVCAHGDLSQVYWMQGKLRAAMREEELCLSWADNTDHVGSRVHAMGLTLLHRVYRRDYAEVFKRAGQLVSFTAEHGMADHGAAGLIFRGWVSGIHGNPAKGLRMLEEGLAREREVSTTEDFPVYLCLLAELLTLVGKADHAVDRILRERSEFDRIELRMWIPELLRVLAESMLIADPTSADRARMLFSEATALAKAQGVLMLSLRIAISEVRLGKQLGSLKQAANRLQQAVKAVPEDDGSFDLLEARRLARVDDRGDVAARDRDCS